MKRPLLTLKPRVALLNTSRAAPLTPCEGSVRIRGRALQERNDRFLSANPLCAHCRAKGRIAAAVEVDHRIALHVGGTETDDNLQGLCAACHKEKNKNEAAARASGVVFA